MGLTKKRYAERVRPGLDVATLCGNMYTATVYAGLASLISNVSFNPAEAKRIGIFSYGSGLAASMYSAKIVGDVSYMVEKLDLHNRLNGRSVLPPQAYDDVRTRFSHHELDPFTNVWLDVCPSRACSPEEELQALWQDGDALP